MQFTMFFWVQKQIYDMIASHHGVNNHIIIIIIIIIIIDMWLVITVCITKSYH